MEVVLVGPVTTCCSPNPDIIAKMAKLDGRFVCKRSTLKITLVNLFNSWSVVRPDSNSAKLVTLYLVACSTIPVAVSLVLS